MKKLIATTALTLLSLAAVHSIPQPPKNTARIPLEQPARLKGVSEQIIVHTGYRISFNQQTLCPNWVAWELTSEEAQGNLRRSNDFQPDPEISERFRVTKNDYKNSGFDRGHMCPAGDMKWSGRAQAECFYMSNMCPQEKSLNSGAWSKLEQACRRWAEREGKIYIVCGPIFNDNRKTRYIGNTLNIRVPDAFFKAVLCTSKGREKAIAFYYTNRKGKQNMPEAVRTIDEVERMTGMDFFPQLDDALEKRVEANANLKFWQ